MRSAIAVALCAVGLSAAAAEPVTYLDWDDANKKMTNAICTAYEVVTAETATFAAGKTYVVTNDVINASDPLGITVGGTSSNPTRLILCDGAKLTVTGQTAAETAGLNVSNGTAIVICGQNGGTGALEATGGDCAAGIGGNAVQAAGTVTIYGGSVTALGKNGAAGIGGGMNKTDTGTVTFGGAGFNVVTGETAAVTAPISQDDYEKDHSAVYVYIEPLVPGSEGNPWTVGGDAEDPTKVVGAWTNGTELVIEGSGTVTDLSKISVGVKDGITAVAIKAGVTGAADGAFAGFDGVTLTLPDGWQGELPKGGAWYGATGVTLAGIPLAVKNVTSQQRYPWNGLVDISCDLTGSGTVTLGVTVLTNDVKFVAKPTILGGTTVDLDAAGGVTNGVKFIWNAAADAPVGFKQGGVQVKVTVEKE